MIRRFKLKKGSTKMKSFDVVVVGAGLAGLTAATQLQLSGKQVLLIEKRPIAGGLCGATVVDGYSFTIACNDFGLRSALEMKRLGVPVTFKTLASRFYNERSSLRSPPDFRTAWQLVRKTAGFWNLITAFRGAPNNAYVGDILAKHRVEPALRDMVGIAAYGMGMPLSLLSVHSLMALFNRKLNYGYTQAVVPVGGPQALARGLLERFEELGGFFLPGTTCESITGRSPHQVVHTSAGEFVAHAVVSSQGRWAEYPTQSHSGLAISAMLLAVPRSFAFPEKVHTLGYLPAGFSEWMEQIHQGQRPQRFGFHLFPNEAPAQADHTTLNVFFYLPRGWHCLNMEQQGWAQGFIEKHIETILPGVMQAAIYKRFLSPSAFQEVHGLSSRVVHTVPPADFVKPEIYDPQRDLYYVGNSVRPEGEHAAGAIVSGLWAASAVLESKIPTQEFEATIH